MAMTICQLKEVRDHCICLAEHIELVLRKAEEGTDGDEVVVMYPIYGLPKETGAVRRRSMDLTRALAQLRSSKF